MTNVSHVPNEQSSGIGQAGRAVSNLDQITQQNAALIERSVAASEDLKAQAVRLQEAVAVLHR